MEVLDDQYEGALPESALGQATDCQEELALQLLGLDVAEAVGRLHAQDEAEERRDADGLLFAPTQRREACGELLARGFERIARGHAVRLPEEGGEHRVWLLDQGGADGMPHRHGLEALGSLEGGEPLQEQARLAHPRLANHAHHLCPPGQHPIEGRDHLPELLRPAHHGRGQPQGLQAPAGAPNPMSPLEPERMERLALPLHRDPADRGQDEGMLGQLMGRGADERLGGARGALEAGGRVHRVAGHRVRAAGRRANGAGHDRARVDPDVKREGFAQTALPSLVERPHTLVHQEGGVERALRIILVSPRSAEHGHDGVPDELLDEAVVALDGARQLSEQVVLKGADFFRVEALAQGSESGQIREQDGHQPPVPLGRTIVGAGG